MHTKSYRWEKELLKDSLSKNLFKNHDKYYKQHSYVW